MVQSREDSWRVTPLLRGFKFFRRLRGNTKDILKRLKNMKNLKFIISCMLFFVHPILSEQSFCANESMKISSSLLNKVKGKFMEEMQAHYNSLVQSKSISQKQKQMYLKQYENLEIKICSNPQNTSQKIVYIEYEKNWWGRLYFTVFNKNEILRWIQINTHGAITKYVRWNENSFFYEDSTHSGTKTQNTCRVQKKSIACEKLKS